MNLLKYLSCNIMRILSWEEIVAEELSRNRVPETGSSQCVEGIHLVLEALLIIINLLEIIYDFYIAFNRCLLLTRSWGSSSVNFFFPFLLILAMFFSHHFRWSFGATFSAGTSNLSWTSPCPSTNNWFNIWIWLVELFFIKRGVVLKAQRCHGFVK